MDSTGFGTCVYRRWYDAKYGKEMKKATWLKAHAIVGTTTNIIASVKVTDSDGADSPQLADRAASDIANVIHSRMGQGQSEESAADS